jgi:hypothetical protein
MMTPTIHMTAPTNLLNRDPGIGKQHEPSQEGIFQLWTKGAP